MLFGLLWLVCGALAMFYGLRQEQVSKGGIIEVTIGTILVCVILLVGGIASLGFVALHSAFNSEKVLFTIGKKDEN